jgi:hypothetical protein
VGRQHGSALAVVQSPQPPPEFGSAISPLLSNLFMHCAVDTGWSATHQVWFERYCDDTVAHCRSESQARLTDLKTNCGRRSRRLDENEAVSSRTTVDATLGGETSSIQAASPAVMVFSSLDGGTGSGAFLVVGDYCAE